MQIQEFIDEVGRYQDEGYSIVWLIDREPFPYFDLAMWNLDCTRLSIFTQGAMDVAVAPDQTGTDPFVVVATGKNWDGEQKNRLLYSFDPKPVLVDWTL